MDQMLEIFTAGGFMMYPLAIAGFIALVLILERLYALQNSKILRPELVACIENMNSKNDLNTADQLSKTHIGPFSSIIQLVFKNRHLPSSEMSQAIEDQGQFEVRYLEKGVSMLETIASIAPLMGLLGTVFGIIKVFDKIEDVGLKDPAVFSGGISEALITTAFGLGIGIIVLIAYNIISKRIENMISQIQHYASDLMLKLKQFESAE
jgi:biopolymer transport protein ExbB